MYIRTKDAVYEVVGFDEDCIIPSLLIKVKNNYGEEKITHCCKNDIINQSEKLEELCDEFIYDYGKDKDRFKNDSLALKILRANNNEKVNIYGAIWTDKGLIYVAKMDSDGVLELI